MVEERYQAVPDGCIIRVQRGIPQFPWATRTYLDRR